MVCLILIANTATASQNKKYFSIKGGVGFDMGTLSDSQTVNMTPTISLPFNKLTNKFTFKFKPGFNIGIEFGQSFDYVRIGGEFTFSHAALKSQDTFQQGNDSVFQDDTIDKEGDITVTFGGLNIYYDLKKWKRVIPYVGVGGGFSSIELEYKNAGTSRGSQFSFQVMVGSMFVATKKTNIMLEYRFLRTNEFAFSKPAHQNLGFENLKDNVITHSINIGVKFAYA